MWIRGQTTSTTCFCRGSNQTRFTCQSNTTAITHSTLTCWWRAFFLRAFFFSCFRWYLLRTGSGVGDVASRPSEAGCDKEPADWKPAWDREPAEWELDKDGFCGRWCSLPSSGFYNNNVTKMLEDWNSFIRWSTRVSLTSNDLHNTDSYMKCCHKLLYAKFELNTKYIS